MDFYTRKKMVVTRW